MGGKLMTREDYEKIVTDRLVFGRPAAQIAEEIGRKDTVVFNVLKAFNITKEQDWPCAIAVLTNQNFPLSVFTWAGEKLGIDLPPSLEAAYNNRLAHARKAQAEREKAANAENIAAQQQDVMPADQPEPPKSEKPDNTSLYLLKLLEAINQQNELLEQLMDAVIPKYVGDLKDNINANCDSLFTQIKDNGDKLEAIKINSRKRGL